MNPDFNSYTLLELYDVKENIDRTLYAERYQLVLLAIAQKEANSSVELNPQKLSLDDKVTILKILLAIIAAYLSWVLFNSYLDGSILTIVKNGAGRIVYLEAEPTYYYITVSIYVVTLVVCLYSLYQRCKKTPNKQINKDT